MKKYLTSMVLILLMNGFANGQTIRYVTPDGAGSKTGTSWDNAYNGTQLQTAINETGITQVWVAKGTYYPTTTTIKYKVTVPGFVSLKVFDVMGAEVATLVNVKKPVGDYTIEWNAAGFGSGIYF